MNAKDWEVLIWAWLLWGAWALLLVGLLIKAIDLIGYGLRESRRWYQKTLYRLMSFIGIPWVLPLALTFLLMKVESFYPIFNLTVANDWNGFWTVWKPVYTVILEIVAGTSAAVILLGADTFRMDTEECAVKVAWQTLLVPALLYVPAVVKYVSVFMAGSVKR